MARTVDSPSLLGVGRAAQEFEYRASDRLRPELDAVSLFDKRLHHGIVVDVRIEQVHAGFDVVVGFHRQQCVHRRAVFGNRFTFGIGHALRTRQDFRAIFCRNCRFECLDLRNRFCL